MRLWNAPAIIGTRAGNVLTLLNYGVSVPEEIQAHVRGKLAPYEYPREIEFIAELPMTTTGKVQRKVLRQREELNTSGNP